MLDPLDAQTVRCPTCRAAQEWSDTCRRCKTDLRLIRETAAAYFESRRECLLHLAAGRPVAALRAARRCCELHPDVEARRLLALAAFRMGLWREAAGLARSLPREG